MGAQATHRSGGQDHNRSCGRGALGVGRSLSVSRGGPLPSADAGISSDKTGANPVHRKPKVSAARFVRCRSVGPKARASAVADGCQVYIPGPGVKVKLAGTLLLGLIWLLVCQLPGPCLHGRRHEWNPPGGSEVIRHGGREKPPRYDTSDRTANRHR